MADTKITFASLDRDSGYPELPPGDKEEFSLPAWYRSVHTIPLVDLGVEDICKACRQQIHPVHIVPLALGMLEKDPLAGELYDGELFCAVAKIKLTVWSSNASGYEKLKTIAGEIIALEAADDDVKQVAKALVSNAPLNHS